LIAATADLSTNLLHTNGTAPPSAILAAIQGTGRDAVLRGSGTGDSSAAVAILETYTTLPPGQSPVRGLVRLVEVADGLSIVDVSVGGALGGESQRIGWGKGQLVERVGATTLQEVGAVSTQDNDGTNGGANGNGGERKWRITLRQNGDLSRGPDSTGAIYDGVDMGLSPISTGEEKTVPRGAVGYVGVGADGRGAAVLVHPISVWEVIGRGVVVEDEASGEKVAGVVARSAGVWSNDKTVCSCSGKTVWEEREEQRARGVL
jgi:copper chaperone for superoxide dismutase